MKLVSGDFEWGTQRVVKRINTVTVTLDAYELDTIKASLETLLETSETHDMDPQVSKGLSELHYEFIMLSEEAQELD